ncbi:MAG TPA: hypothetical protein VL349_00965, partial [Terriglobales bacterium]|nr:hypothetical protein [Terriglobales bacterium]
QIDFAALPANRRLAVANKRCMIGEHISLAIDFIARLCGKVAPAFTRISGALEQKPRGRQPGPQLSLLAGGPEKGLSLAARICPF